MTEDKEEKVNVICSTDNRGCIPGEWTHCKKCSREVYLSTSTIAAVIEQLPERFVGLSETDAIVKAANMVNIYCFTCALPIMVEDKDLKLLKMGEEQKNQVVDYVKIERQKKYN